MQPIYFMQFEFLGKGFSGFTKYDSFKNYFLKLRKVTNNMSIFLGMKNVPLLQERLARMAFLITKKEALPDLPEKVYDVVEVEMTEEQREIYNATARSLAITIENEQGLDKEMSVNSVLTRLLRLAQITSGFVTSRYRNFVLIISWAPNFKGS